MRRSRSPEYSRSRQQTRGQVAALAFAGQMKFAQRYRVGRRPGAPELKREPMTGIHIHERQTTATTALTVVHQQKPMERSFMTLALVFPCAHVAESPCRRAPLAAMHPCCRASLPPHRVRVLPRRAPLPPHRVLPRRACCHAPSCRDSCACFRAPLRILACALLA